MDNYVGLGTRTRSAGDITAKICDGTTNTQLLAVDSSGRITAIIIDNGGAISIDDNSGSITVDTTFEAVDGATAPSKTVQIGGKDGSGNIQAILTDTSGVVAIQDGGGNISIDDGGNSITVDGSVSISGTVTVDSELPAAVALSDSTANPTAPMVGAGVMGWNVTGSVWKRLRINDSNELVVTTSAGAPTSPTVDTLTSSALAAGGNTTLNGTQIASGKTGKLRDVVVASTTALKIEIQVKLNGTATNKIVAFTSAAVPSFHWVSPHADFITAPESATAGLDAFSVKVTNLDDAVASDVYATLCYEVV